jgi:oligopeptide transport system substrate-binding protein
MEKVTGSSPVGSTIKTLKPNDIAAFKACWVTPAAYRATNRAARALLWTGLVLFVSWGLSGCQRRDSRVDAAVSSQTLLLGNGAEPADLDPQFINAVPDANVVYALFEGLTKLDRSGNALPAGASSWEVTPDGVTYTFHLRPQALWSDGLPVTAADYVYAFHRILTPSFAAVTAYMLWPIRNAEAFNAGRMSDFGDVGVRAADEHTLVITLERPTPYLPALASHNSWFPVPRQAIERFGKMADRNTRWSRPGNLVGNGAFLLTEWSPGARIVAERSPGYWDAGRVRLRRIEFYPYENADTEELNYRSGQLHVTYGLPMAKVRGYRQEHPAELLVDPTLSTFYLFFNTRRPPFDNVKLRLALAHAADRDAISADIARGVYPPAHSLTPPGCAGYQSRGGITDDLAEARRLLAEAGYPGGQGLPPIELQCDGAELPLRVVEALQRLWEKELGVHVTIAQMEMKTLYQNQQQGNFAIGFSGWQADYVDPFSFLGTMTSTSGNNWAGWSNKEFDRILDEAQGEPDPAKRNQLYQRAEDILLSEAPLMPLFYRPQVYLKSPLVHGWEPAVLGIHYLTRVWLEK